MALVKGKVTEEVNGNGELVVHCPDGRDEVYAIITIPEATMYLVENAKGEILMDLGLQSVLTDLNRASDLLFLAYLGVVGTGDLHARISNRQKELAELCGDCEVTMTTLVTGSRDVLDRLTEAYRYLLVAKEDRALRILSRCAANAKEMAGKCEELARGFGKLKEDTKEDAETATKAWGAQVVKIKELKKLRDEMEATKAEQDKLTEEYNNSLEEMKSEIAKAEAKEDLANQRAFISEIVGVIAKTVGAGLGAYVSMKQPFSVPPKNDEASDQGGKPNAAEKKKLEEQEATKKKELEDAKSAQEEATSKESELRDKVFAAGADKKSKKEQLKSAEAADKTEPGYDEKVKKAKAELETSAAALSKLEEEQKKAQEAAKKAKEKVSNATAALNAAAAALTELANSASQASQQQAERAAALAKSRMNLIQQKIDLEKLRRTSVSQVAKLTARLKSTEEETQVEESAQTALEIATWALDNIYASLLNAKFFWDNMRTFCEKLAKPKVLEQIKDETDFNGDDPEERIRAYKSKSFVTVAVGYLARWVALASVCEDYVAASAVARKSVLGHIRQSPNAEEARKLIGPLKIQLNDELQSDAAAANTNIRNLQQNLENGKKQMADAKPQIKEIE
jgi:chemotaxis protein histidine kinase CheA